MANILQLMPTLESDEMVYIQGLIKELSDDHALQFANIYNSRRKDPMMMLLCALLGFIGIAGVQRFVVGQTGMGLLYLFTAGLCLIGTVIDIVSHKRLAFEYNTMTAQQVLAMVKASN